MIIVFPKCKSYFYFYALNRILLFNILMAVTNLPDNPQNDLGLGNKAVKQRIINRDGSINIKRKGIPYLSTFDNYNSLITMRWGKFWFIVIGAYLLTNIIFATIYVTLGIDNLLGADMQSPLHQFLSAFFFSAQTLSTVGYGHVSPKGIPTNIVAAFESMLGLLAFAIATGLLYGRISRPSAKIEYSDNILIAPYAPTGRGVMLRLASKRRTVLIDLTVEIIFSYNEEINGKIIRRFHNLKLERSQVSILTLSWTVVHPIDEQSPLYHITPEILEAGQASFVVLLQAFDDTFSQTVHSRTSYMFNEVIWGGKFNPAFYDDPNGLVTLDITKISDFTPADIPRN
jgi:inward rectifier potassium channel